EHWRSTPLVRPHPESALGRAALTKQVVQIDDVREGPAYSKRDPISVAGANLNTARKRLGAMERAGGEPERDGPGKTKAAPIWSDRFVSAGLVDGMYFAVPTRSAATELHGRISKIMSSVHSSLLGRLFPACLM